PCLFLMKRILIALNICILATLFVNIYYIITSLDKPIQVTDNCIILKDNTYCKISKFDICKINNYSCALSFVIILFGYLAKSSLLIAGIIFLFKLGNFVVYLDRRYGSGVDVSIV
ncbi:putative nonstructural protein, partial [Hemipteran phasma-related virus OKIAV247]